LPALPGGARGPAATNLPAVQERPDRLPAGTAEEGGGALLIKILLKFPHGLGDVVQASVMLKHLRRHRPDWQGDIVGGRGKHTPLKGLSLKVYHDQEERPPDPYYRQVVDLGWFENYNKYPDKPNSKITNCLHEVFGLGWDADLGRYEVCCSHNARHRA